MKVGIVGAGAIGTVLGAELAIASDVRVLVRDADTASAIAQRGGLLVEGQPRRPATVSDRPRMLADVEVLIVAVKTYATHDALAPLRRELDPQTTVLSIQNGIEAERAIEAALGPRRAIALGPTTEAGMLLGPGCVRRTSHGVTQLGWAAGHDGGSDALFALHDAFGDAGLRAHTVDDIAPFVWGKLAINAGIGPVTALARITNGELLERPADLARARAIAGEVANVATTLRIVLPYGDPGTALESVAAATAANRSSMLQDLERGRPTEIDAILGRVVELGRSAGVDVAQCAAAYDEVRARVTA